MERKRIHQHNVLRLISKLLNAKSVLLSNRRADFQLFFPFGTCQHIIFCSPAAIYDRRSIIKTIQFTFERNFPQYLTLPALLLNRADMFTCLLQQDDVLNFIFPFFYLYDPLWHSFAVILCIFFMSYNTIFCTQTMDSFWSIYNICISCSRSAF